MQNPEDPYNRFKTWAKGQNQESQEWTNHLKLHSYQKTTSRFNRKWRSHHRDPTEEVKGKGRSRPAQKSRVKSWQKRGNQACRHQNWGTEIKNVRGIDVSKENKEPKEFTKGGGPEDLGWKIESGRKPTPPPRQKPPQKHLLKPPQKAKNPTHLDTKDSLKYSHTFTLPPPHETRLTTQNNNSKPS